MLNFKNQKPKADLFWAPACDKFCACPGRLKTHETQPLRSSRSGGDWVSRKGMTSPGRSDSKEGPATHTHTHTHTHTCSLAVSACYHPRAWLLGWDLKEGLSRRKGTVLAAGAWERRGPGANQSLCAPLHLTPAGTPIPTAPYSSHQMKATPRSSSIV